MKTAKLLPVRGYRTPAQVARVLRVSVAKVLRLIEGPLDAYAFPQGLRISSEQLEAYRRRCA